MKWSEGPGKADWGKEIQSTCFWFSKVATAAAAAAKLLQSCLTLLSQTPELAAHQAPPPLGFSKQEYCSGLPFPSPMQESEKGKWSHSVVSNS